MAAPTNAYLRQDQTNVFEDYENTIYLIQPTEVPHVTGLDQKPADNNVVDHTVDEYEQPADPGTADGNAWLDGDEFSAGQTDPPTKIRTYCQVQRKDYTISRRAQIVDKAGERDEVSRQDMKKGVALRFDMEVTALYNQAHRDETGTTVAKLAGMPTWIIGTTDGRADRGATGADPASFGAVKTDGTKRALSEQGMLNVQQAVYTKSRLLPNTWLLDLTTKANFSRYMFSSSARIPNQNQEQGATPRGKLSVNAAVGYWETDFGRNEMVPDIYMPNRAEGSGYDAFLYPMGYIHGKFLTNMRVYPQGRRSDTEERTMLVDWAQAPNNPDACGTFADIDESLDMVA